MKKIIFTLFAAALVSMAMAQTPVPAGSVSGTWTSTGSPYLIQGDIVIDNGNTLTIEPGVRIEFQGLYNLAVQGRLLAVGSATDSILFTALDTVTGFNSVHFDNTPSSNDSSLFVYCRLEHGHRQGSPWPYNGSGAIGVRAFGKIRIDHCSFFHNHALNNLVSGYPGGGAVGLIQASILIQNCLFEENECYYGGALIAFDHSYPIINNCVFKNNSAVEGGGAISVNDASSPTIMNSIFIGNISNSRGGGIYIAPAINTLGSSDPEIKGNVFYDNHALSDGGAVEIMAPAFPVLSNNTMLGNTAVRGGALDIFNSDPVVNSCILWGNVATEGNQVYIWNELSAPGFYFSDIEGGNGAFGGAQFSGPYLNNIEDQPLFCDTAAMDFHLQDCSPCIDLGDTACIASNGTRCDIGAYDGGYCPCVGIEAHDGNTAAIRIFPMPVHDQCRIRYELAGTGNVCIEIVDLHGRVVMEILRAYQNSGILEQTTNLSTLHPGFYLCRITHGSGVSSARIIKY